ncbi:ornithine carbamoyltransferase [bacterium BMS3Abin09]|nr:ornithine carbamoyltransferase [bacterium BMS3Abin09]HDN95076.1 ornithine carbamoyltransferase [Nitrospirota bacterium]
MNKDFLTLLDLSSDEIEKLIERAAELKSGKDSSSCPLIGKSIGLLFDKTSTRTRISFQTGIYQLGAQSIYINKNELQLGRGESIEDTAKVLSRYLHGIVIRTYTHSSIEKLAANAEIPIVNGLTDLHHPCQALADMLTIKEKKGKLKDIRIAYIGDGNNVANSLLEAALLTGVDLVIACPKGYEPDKKIYDKVVAGGAKVQIVSDPAEAAKNADVLYTDVWISMGQEQEIEKRRNIFKKYQINKKLLSLAKPDAIVMHCLPAHRGEEITADVLDSQQSVVIDQAENRLHTQKALLEMLIK